MKSRMSIGRESSHHSEVHYLLPERELSLGLDLVRCESFQSLDQSTLARFLTKNYSLLVCMALPLSTSTWTWIARSCFLLYQVIPLLPSWAPPPLAHSSSRNGRCGAFPGPWLSPSSWSPPGVTEVPTLGALSMLQDALLHSPVLLQLFRYDESKAWPSQCGEIRGTASTAC